METIRSSAPKSRPSLHGPDCAAVLVMEISRGHDRLGVDLLPDLFWTAKLEKRPSR